MKTMAKKETNNAERRKCQRLCLVLSIKYKKSKDSCFHNAIACQDISGKGLKILLHEALKIEDRIQILLCLPDKTNRISTFCSVVWCRQNEDDNFMAGLEFVKIKEHERFMEFLCEKIVDLSLTNKLLNRRR